VSVNGQPGVEFSVWEERVGAFLSHGVSVLTFGSEGITGFTTFLDPGMVATHG